MSSVLIVMTNCEAGKEEEFNKWYQEVHLKEVCQLPGFVGARRYELTESQMSEEERPFRFLAIYEIEGDTDAAFETLQASAPNMNMSATLAESSATHFSAIGDRVQA
jgi:Tfp pilus assembly protein PilP